MNPRLENSLALLIGSLSFAPIYVHATMNALYDAYFVGISEFKQPFIHAFQALLLLLIGITVISIIRRILFNLRSSILYKIALSILVANFLTLVLGQAPCFFPHTDPHTLESIFKQSLFCPNFSNRSYMALLLMIGLCVTTMLTARSAKQ